MKNPASWIHSQLKTIGVEAYPVDAGAGMTLPFVVYRQSSQPVNSLSNVISPQLETEYTLTLYAATYTGLHAKADEVRQVLCAFGIDAGDVTFEHCLFVASADSEPEYDDGQEKPVYVLEMTFSALWPKHTEGV